MKEVIEIEDYQLLYCFLTGGLQWKEKKNVKESRLRAGPATTKKKH